MAIEMRQKIALIPNASDSRSHQTVTAEARGDTVYVSNLVGGPEESNAVDEIVRSVERLHTDQVDNHAVVQ